LLENIFSGPDDFKPGKLQYLVFWMNYNIMSFLGRHNCIQWYSTYCPNLVVVDDNVRRLNTLKFV